MSRRGADGDFDHGACSVSFRARSRCTTPSMSSDSTGSHAARCIGINREKSRGNSPSIGGKTLRTAGRNHPKQRPVTQDITDLSQALSIDAWLTEHHRVDRGFLARTAGPETSAQGSSRCQYRRGTISCAASPRRCSEEERRRGGQHLAQAGISPRRCPQAGASAPPCRADRGSLPRSRALVRP